jgi:hypothetical protein
MAFHGFLFLLVVFLLLCLVLLWRLCWPHLQPFHSRGGARRSTLHRLLKPRSPDDCPACRLGSTASSGTGPVPADVASLARGQKPARSAQAGQYRGLRLSQPGVLVFRDHRGSDPRTCRGWQAWSCRADPDLSLPGLPHHVQCSARYSVVPSENSLPCRVAVVHSALAEGLDPSAAERVFGYRQATITTWLSRAGEHAQTLHKHSHLAPSSSRTYSWMNCEHGSAAVDRCSGSGWPLTPAPSFFPCLSSVPAPKPWPIGSSTRSDRAWPPFCIPLLTSDGLNLYFSALTAHFGQWLPLGRRGRKVLRWQVAAGLIYGQVKKSYRRRQLVRVMPVMLLLTQADLSVALQAMSFSGRLNTATTSRLNLTVRHGVAALARRTWATAQQSPQLLANLEGWRASSPLVRPHHSLRLALVQPRERGGRLLAQRYRQRTPALAVGRTNRRWTACEVLSYPLPPVCA